MNVQKHSKDLDRLKESEKRYRTIADNINEVILVAQDDKLPFVNRKAVALFGYSEMELRAKPFMEFVHPEDRSLVADNHRRRLQGETIPSTYEFRALAGDGTIKWMEINSVLIDWDGKPATLNLLTDIHKRKKIEESLRDSEERFRRIFQESALGMVLVSPEFYFLIANDAFCKMLGYSEPELQRKTFQDVTHPEDRAVGRELVNGVLSGKGESFQLEKRYLHKDGTMIWGSVHSSLIRDKQNHPLYFVTQIQNINDRKIMEEALHDSEKKFATAFQTAPFSIEIARCRDEALIEVNDSFTSLFGFSKEEILADASIHCMLWTNQRERNIVLSSLQNGMEVNGREVSFQRRNGEVFTGLYSAKTIEIKNEPCLLSTVTDISRQKKAEEELKKYQTLLKASIESIKGSYISSIDRDYNYLYFNDAHRKRMKDVYGSDIEVGMNRLGCISVDEDRQSMKQKYDRALSGESYSITKAYHDESVFYNSSYNPIKNDDDEVIGVTEFAFDISERMKIEEDLKKSQVLLKSSIESIKGAFLSSIDNEYRYLYFNEAHRKRMKDIYGVAIEIGRNLLDCITIDTDRKITIDRYGRALWGEDVTIIDSYRDEPTTYESRFNPIRNEKNEVIGATAFSMDITDRIKSQEAIKKSQKLLESIIDAIQGASISCIDRNFNYLYFNSTHKKWMKKIYDTEVAIGKNLFDLISVEEEKYGTRMKFDRAFAGESFTIVRGYKNASSTHENTFTPIRNEINEIIGVTAFSLDITDRVNAENEKHRSEEYLQQVQRLESLGVLAGGIAHDFNNILTGIFGFIDLARNRVKDDKASHFLSQAMDSMERAKGLTQQLLTFAKGGTPVKKTASIAALIKDTSHLALSGSNVKCNHDVPEDLWNCEVDKNQIGQVLQNLMINAVQAMPMGGVIDVVARNVALNDKEHPTLSKGNYVSIRIRDQGIGIAKEMLPRIFDPFFTTKEKGHGLGLAISYSIIKRHHGAIDACSEIGKGSVFHIYLPADSGSSSLHEKTGTVRHKGTGTMIVLDDEEAVRNLTAEMLHSFGYSTICVEDGKQAIELLSDAMKKGILITGMILDLTIPGGMGGKEAAAEIRKITGETPLFVSSGYAEDPIMAKPHEYGFTGSISKPFGLEELMQLLEKHLSKK